MFSTCRALQSLLTTSLPSPPIHIPSSKAPHDVPALASPIALTAPKTRANQDSVQRPVTPPSAKVREYTPQPPQSPHRTSRKRRRSSFDDDDEDDQKHDTQREPSTPKRQRLCPPSLPLGLDRADFAALHSTPTTLQSNNLDDHITPSRSTQQEENKNPTEDQENTTSKAPQPSSSSSSSSSPANCPSPFDDSRLVSLILHKLRLRQSDWDELGKGDKDSIGERWRVLVGDEEMGLRRMRGKGGKQRGSLQTLEFGGPLVR